MHAAIGGVITNFTIIFVLIYLVGINGAAIGTVITEIVVAIYQIICCKDVFMKLINVGIVIKPIAATVIGTVIILFVGRGYGVFLKMTILLLLFLAIYLSIMLLLNNVAINYDHIIPLRDGGCNDPTNYQLMCEHCNKSENAKSHAYKNLIWPTWPEG